MTNPACACIYCEQSSQAVPLLPFIYYDEQYYICPQHLPILIHQPARLADKLPGLERVKAEEGHA